MPLTVHPAGNYRFLPGIAPYSCGVVSMPDFEIAHVTLQRPLPLSRGFVQIERYLDAEKRPRAALCAIELRSPRPFTFLGFADFNVEYAEILRDWGLFVEGVNPVARTNVAPAVRPPVEPSLYGFSFTRPCAPSELPTFVVAGAGELPEGILAAESIVRLGDLTPAGDAAKASFVVELMENRLRGLGADWTQVNAIDVYTVHPIERLLPEVILTQAGAAATHGIRWFFSRPPIEQIEVEMDLRGVRSEFWIR